MQKIVEMLEEVFDVKPRIKDGKVLLNVQIVNGSNLLDIKSSGLYEVVSNIEIKRSGTGLVIIATPVQDL